MRLATLLHRALLLIVVVQQLTLFYHRWCAASDDYTEKLRVYERHNCRDPSPTMTADLRDVCIRAEPLVSGPTPLRRALYMTWGDLGSLYRLRWQEDYWGILLLMYSAFCVVYRTALMARRRLFYCIESRRRQRVENAY